jgi:hypothetical protein
LSPLFFVFPGSYPKDNVCCLSGAWRLCSKYTFVFPDFLPPSHLSCTRDLWRKWVCAPQALEKQTDREIAQKKGSIRATEKRLEGFRFNPPSPPFNSSLFCQLSMFYKQARSTDNEPAASQEIAGKKILLGKIVREPEEDSSGENRYTNESNGSLS